MEFPPPRKPRVPAPRSLWGPLPRRLEPPEADDLADLSTFTFTAPKAPAPPAGRVPVRALFEAHLHYAQRRRERREVIAALAVSSFLPWLSLMWPNVLPSSVRELAFLVWGALLALSAAVTASELRWYRRIRRYADEIRAD